jgi:hypothetical protein
VLWQRTGELTSAVIAMGLHQPIVDPDIPFFLKEFRKKSFIFTYAADKSWSAFFGRPPRLSQRYCHLQMPLDLNDQQIMSSGEELDHAIRSLDPEGWNKTGKFQICTTARIHAQHSRIKEEILELSLGISDEGIVEKAEDIQKKADKFYNNLPTFLQRHKDEEWVYDRPAIEVLFLVYIRIEYLNQAFLLQRTLIKRAGADSTSMITVARKIFCNIIGLINHRDTMRDFQLDLSMMVRSRGIIYPLEYVRKLNMLCVDLQPRHSIRCSPRY